MPNDNLPADFRVYVNLCRNKKTKRLIRDLDFQAFYCVVALWCYATENCPDGNLGDIDAFDLADVSLWPEDRADEWLIYLVEKGWLDRRGSDLIVHDWEKMQPWASRDRSKQSEANRRNANLRWAKEKENANSHAIAMQSQCDTKMQLQCPHSQPIPIPNPILEQEHIGSNEPRTNRKEDAGASPALLGELYEPKMSEGMGEKKTKAKKEPNPSILAKSGIKRSITFDPQTFTLSGITPEDREQWRGYAPGVDIDAEIEAFLDYMQTHPEALARTIKTGAWKAALNTRFRNVEKYGAGNRLGYRSRTEQPHPFFDNKGTEFASAKMMRKIAEEEAMQKQQDEMRRQAVEVF